MAAAPRRVEIDPRFNGPPESANGGYACGVVAGALTDGPARVTLRRPPPLGLALDVVEAAGGVELRHEGQLVATATEWDGEVEVGAPPNQAALDAAVRNFDLDLYTRHHAFDRCFTCGPRRAVDDGLRIFPAAIADSTQVAWPWTPSPSTASDSRRVDPPVVWAALDCPSGLSWITSPNAALAGPAVLGQLAVRIDRRPQVGEALMVGGWQTGADGRKLFAGAAVWTTEGEAIAAAAATWIVLTPEQAETFGAKGR